MALEQQVLKGTTGTLITYPPLVGPSGVGSAGNLANATVRIGTPSVAMPVSSVPAAIDPTDMRQTYAASILAFPDAGDDVLHLTGTTPVVNGRKYLLARSVGDSQPYVVKCVKQAIETVVSTHLDMWLEEPLQPDVLQGGNVPAGNGDGSLYGDWYLDGYAITYDLTAEQTATEGDSLAIWSVEIAGEKYEWHQPFKVVRQFVHPDLTGTDLLAQYPQVQRLSISGDSTLSEAIGSAWENLIIPALEARGMYWERIKTVRRLNPPLALATVYHLQRADARFPLDVLEESRQEYLRALDVAFQSVDFWYDGGNSDARKHAQDLVPAYRQLRLSR